LSIDNPADEIVEDDPENIEEQILEMFTPEEPEEEFSTTVQKVTVDEALEVLTLHEEQAHNGDPEFILRLERQSRILTLLRTVENVTQMTLDSWVI
jgi:hypothetical protein